MPRKKTPYEKLSYSGQTRRRWGEQGLCVQCGSPAVKPLRFCERHIDWVRPGTPRSCAQCTVRVVEAPRKLCDDCLRDNNCRGQREQYQRYKKAGKCRCGKRARKNRTTCRKCGRYHAEMSRHYHAEMSRRCRQPV